MRRRDSRRPLEPGDLAFALGKAQAGAWGPELPPGAKPPHPSAFVASFLRKAVQKVSLRWTNVPAEQLALAIGVHADQVASALARAQTSGVPPAFKPRAASTANACSSLRPSRRHRVSRASCSSIIRFRRHRRRPPRAIVCYFLIFNQTWLSGVRGGQSPRPGHRHALMARGRSTGAQVAQLCRAASPLWARGRRTRPLHSNSCAPDLSPTLSVLSRCKTPDITHCPGSDRCETGA